MRNDLMLRALQVIRMMSRRREYRLTHQQLAKEMGVCVRTARRWIRACEDAHVPMPPHVTHWRDVQ